MPYSVGKSSSCPPSKPFAVLKDGGTVVPGGCHATRQDALKHQRALMVNVEDASVDREFARRMDEAEDERPYRQVLKDLIEHEAQRTTE
jgi:hypothetical protein